MGTFLVILSLFYDLFLISTSYFLIITISCLYLRFLKLGRVKIDFISYHISFPELNGFQRYNQLIRKKSDLGNDDIKNIIKKKLEELDEEFGC